MYVYIHFLKLISISDNDADSNSVSIFAFSGLCTASLIMTLLHVFPTITEIVRNAKTINLPFSSAIIHLVKIS